MKNGLLKKGLLALALAGVGTAGAQSLTTFSVNLGGAYGSGNLGVNFGVTAQNLFNLGTVPVDARVSADISRGGVVFNGDVFATYDAGGFLLYGGPGIDVGSGTGVGLALTGGLNYPIADRFGLYAEGSLRLLNSASSVIRVGVTYDF